MKKMLKKVSALCIVFTFLLANAVFVYGFSGSGSGTETNPYIIKTTSQLKEIRSNMSAHYKLGQDIDLSTASFTPLGGSDDSKFTGTLDGAGYAIRNLKVTTTKGEAGLFGYIRNGTVKNLRIEKANVSGGEYAGIVAGYGENAHFENVIVAGTIEGKGYAGAIAGYMLNGSLEYALSTADVSGRNAGGLLGGADGSVTIDKSYSTADISASVASTTPNSTAGGLVGLSKGALTIDEAYYKGSIKKSNNGTGADQYYGGLIGQASSLSKTTKIQNSYALGDIAAANMPAAGLVGFINSGGLTEVKYSYSAMGIANSGADKYGLTYKNLGTIVYSYFDSAKSGVKEPATQAKTTAQLMNKSNLAGWDFGSIWSVGSGSTYPALQRVSSLDTSLKISKVSVSNASSNSVTLSWAKVSNADYYEIKYDGNVETTTGTKVKIDGLSSGTYYTFSVRAVKGEKSGMWTSSARTKTSNSYTYGSYYDRFYDRYYYDDYYNGDLWCSRRGSNSLTVEWDSVYDAYRYEIYYSSRYGSDYGNTRSYNSYTTLYNLKSDTVYDIEVRAVDRYGYTLDRFYGSFRTYSGSSDYPDYPSSIGHSNVTNTSATISWSRQRDADYYEILVNNRIYSTYNTSYDLTGLSPNTVYYYSVRTIRDSRASDWSSLRSFVTTGQVDNSIPAPTGLTATNITQTTADISWNTVASAAKYQVELTGAYHLLESNTNSGEFINLTPATTYTIKVRAVNAAGVAGQWSTEYTFTTEGNTDAGLGRPTGLTATDITQTGAKLTWTAATGPVASYQIEVNGSSTYLSATGLTHTWTALNPNSRYSVRVRAVSTSGTFGQWSDTCTFDTLSAGGVGIPSGLTTTSLTQTTATVSWGAVSDATGYQVRLNSGTPVNATGTSHTFNGLTANTSYTVQVRAAKTSGSTTIYSEWSTALPFSTTGYAIGTPANFQVDASSVNLSSFKVTWAAVSGANTYTITYTPDGGAASSITGIPGTATDYTLTPLTSATKYTVTINAVDSSNQAGGQATLTQYTNMPAPTLTVHGVTHNSVELRWTAIPEAVNYTIGVQGGGTYSTGNTTSYVVTGLTPGTSYNFNIQAISSQAGLKGDVSGYIPATTNLAANEVPVPTGLAVDLSATTYDSITLTWNEVSLATYKVVATAGSQTLEMTAPSSATPMVTFTGLTPQTTYQFKVMAILSGNNSNYSSLISGTTSALPAPTGLASGTVTADAIDLTWDSVLGATSYTVSYQKTPGGAVQTVSVTPSGSPESTTLTGLDHSSQYTISVKVHIGDKESPYSTPPINETTAALVVPVPTGLTVTARTSNSITLDWIAVPGATGYNIKVNGTVHGIGNGAATSHTVTGLTPNASYNFEIEAVNGAVTSGYSAAVPGLTMLEPPTGFTATPQGGGMVEFTWNPVSGADSYTITLADDTPVASGVATPPHTATVSTGTQIFKIQAKSSANESIQVYSNTINVASIIVDFQPDSLTEIPPLEIIEVPEVPETTAVPTPGGFALRLMGSNTIIFEWLPAEGATAYEIADESGAVMATAGEKDIRASLNNVAPGDYGFKIRALNGQEYSPWSHVDKVTIKDPNAPAVPDNTGTPETPVAPEPGNTGTPEVPSTPEPGNTGTPEIPAAPEPGNTGTPEVPTTPEPENTGTPEVPAAPQPDNTGTPETPVVPEPGTATEPNPEPVKYVAPVGGLQVDQITANSAKVSWAAVEGAVSYNVYFDGRHEATGGTSITVSGLAPNTRYQFNVRAVSEAGVESADRTIAVNTLAAAPPAPEPVPPKQEEIVEPAETQKPEDKKPDTAPAPTPVQPEENKATTPPAQPEEGKTTTPPAQPEENKAETPAPKPLEQDKDEASTTIPAAPQPAPANPVKESSGAVGSVAGISCTNATDNSLSFSWGSANGAKYYEVEFNGVRRTASTSISLYNLQPGTAYTIRVRAVGDGGASPWATASGTTAGGVYSGVDNSR